MIRKAVLFLLIVFGAIECVIFLSYSFLLIFQTVAEKEEMAYTELHLQQSQGFHRTQTYSPGTSIQEPSVSEAWASFVQTKMQRITPSLTSTIFVGDIMLSREVAQRIRTAGDVGYPFKYTRDYLQSADFVAGNLEAPITPGRTIQSGEMVFHADPGVEQGLKDAGFSLVFLANNHIPNFGEKGIDDTISLLNDADIAYSGGGINEDMAYLPTYSVIQDRLFRFLSYTSPVLVPDGYEASEDRAGTAFMDIDTMKESVASLEDQTGITVVSMHDGIEYGRTPSKTQTTFAHTAIDAGAEIVVGHHPHVIQKAEIYNDKIIFYSLGNFVFDQMWSDATRESVTAKIIYADGSPSKIEFLPAYIENYSQPKFVINNKGQTILDILEIPNTSSLFISWNLEKNAYDTFELKNIFTFDPSQKITSAKTSVTLDADMDSLFETYTLNEGVVQIIENNTIVYTTPENWWVDSFKIADSTGDGIPDIHLSLWKEGSFGSSKPYWMENDMSIKNHFFVFNLTGNSLKAVWESSNLDAPNCEFTFADLDGDSKEELIVIEGEYTDTYTCNGNFVAVWKWNQWGYTNIWRSEQGTYQNLDVHVLNQIPYIVVQK